MLRKAFAISAVVVALGVLPSAATAQGFDQGDWELQLTGNGANGNDFDGFTVGASGSLGYFMTDALELSLRQSVNYNDIAVDSNITASTRVAADWHFDMGQWQPFIGANIGYVYGEGVEETFAAGPEAGIKYFVNNTTFISLLAEYQFFFDEGDDADDAFNDGQFIYSLGIGFRF